MPEGLLYSLSAKLPLEGLSRVSTIACETGPFLFIQQYIQEALNNCLEINEGSKPHVHLLLFANDVNSLYIPESRMRDVTVYNFVRDPSLTLDGNLYGSFINGVTSKPERSHLMIIDDYSVFSVLTSCRNVRSSSEFFRKVLKRLRKLFLFFHKESLSTEEISVIYNLSNDIAYLQPHPESISANCSSSNRFTCDLLKIRQDRRVSHDKSVFQLSNDGIKEEIVRESNSKESGDSSEVFKNLTTFKLTLEDGERESKNKLHLPYFEARKTSLQDPENFDDFDDDEEDEEV